MQELANSELAIIARRLLLENGGFTLDKYGKQPAERLWCVAVKGKGVHYADIPSVSVIEAYLQADKLDDEFFGGWFDGGQVYLDHTLLFLHRQTAVQEAERNHQEAIYHLETGETFRLPKIDTPDDRARKFARIIERWAREEPAAIDALCEMFPKWARGVGLR